MNTYDQVTQIASQIYAAQLAAARTDESIDFPQLRSWCFSLAEGFVAEANDRAVVRGQSRRASRESRPVPLYERQYAPQDDAAKFDEQVRDLDKAAAAQAAPKPAHAHRWLGGTKNRKPIETCTLCGLERDGASPEDPSPE